MVFRDVVVGCFRWCCVIIVFWRWRSAFDVVVECCCFRWMCVACFLMWFIVGFVVVLVVWCVVRV